MNIPINQRLVYKRISSETLNNKSPYTIRLTRPTEERKDNQCGLFLYLYLNKRQINKNYIYK